MVNEELANSYLRRARIRFDVLQEFLKRDDYADTVREAQEIVELVQKALLIKIGIQPPKWHDVGNIIDQHLEEYPSQIRDKLKKLNKEAKWLRSQRELAFYGDMDIIPEELYTKEDALRAVRIAKDYLSIAQSLPG
ncbi:HEPN domain-containing protein [Hydrogenivirga sp. 128-5-R1-1]|uniref:HEPN domain-containing protein n=1 Tax=Hydrogenivirga sp. 128-5-R1-1 TaxID=392423 RepID=UPI00015EF831|nr:HEPN domain-containing protein [Hydrogenivirga sp. 128-5-R1-1]EDP74905.1 nucleotidyltransferase/HEPN domain protein [Hydrogenivirga sp. 128-5-R1-1]